MKNVDLLHFTEAHVGEMQSYFHTKKEFNKPAFAQARKSTHPQKTPLSKDSNQT